MAIAIPILDVIQKLVGLGKDSGLIKTPEDEMKMRAQLMGYFAQEDNFLAQQAAAINATMQAETKSEHWAQWLWRPLVGFTFSAVILNNYILMPYLSQYARPIDVPAGVWNAMLVILGAAAATRGWEKVTEIRARLLGLKENGNGNGTAAAPAPVRDDVPVREGRE